MRFILITVALAFLVSCDVNPSKFGKDEARGFIDKITYVKDPKTNLCFALVASRKTGDANQSGMGMSVVPCAAIEKYLE